MGEKGSYLEIIAQDVAFEVSELPYFVGSTTNCELQISSPKQIVFAIIWSTLHSKYEVVVNDSLSVNSIEFLQGCPNIPLNSESNVIVYSNLEFVVKIVREPSEDEGECIDYFRQRNFYEI